MSRRSSAFVFGSAAVVLVALLAGGIWYQFFRDDAPPPVTLEAAAAAVSDSPASVATSTATAPRMTPSAGDSTVATATDEPSGAITLAGTWSVVGGSDTFVGYRIGEELATVGTTEAVGRTSDVDGSFVIEGSTLPSATVTADLTTVTSDEARRDRALKQQALETGTYPHATFELTSPLDPPASLGEGQAVSLTAQGDLTLHGITQTIEIPLDVQLSNGVLVVVGSLDITLEDYGITQPSAPIVASVNDHGVLELQLVLTQSST